MREGVFDDAASVLAVDVDAHFVGTPMLRREIHGAQDLAVVFADDLNRG